jgi:hypothetical protein
MNKKTIYIIVAVLVVVIVIAGAAAFLLMNNGGGGGATPTPTPEPTALTVVDASTLQFNVAETTSGVTLNYAFASKNVNTSTQVVRMDILSTTNYSYIVDLGASTSFLSTDNGATWAASDFAADSAYIVAFADYQTALVNWDGHSAEYSYTASDGRGIVISAIHVNPTLDEATYFTHS